MSQSASAFGPALLALEDGRIFEGESFGATGTCVGEVCFNTSMTGYQEVLTDPSYRGQIVAMTYPLIGNYGTNAARCREPLAARPRICHRGTERDREQLALGDFARRLFARMENSRRAGDRHPRADPPSAHTRRDESLPDDGGNVCRRKRSARAVEGEGVIGMDYVREVTTPAAYQWDPDDRSERWSGRAENSEEQTALPPIRHRIVAYDYGIKENILRRLRQNGFGVTVVPATTTAEEVLALKPEAFFFPTVRAIHRCSIMRTKRCADLMGRTPIFGICLGHQMLGYAFGGTTFKLKFGHRGGNQPVKDLTTGKVAITSQNHGFAVDPESLPTEVEVTHVNLNDGTVEGMRHRELPIFSVQYHPEAAPGPHDAGYFFAQFARSDRAASQRQDRRSAD